MRKQLQHPQYYLTLFLFVAAVSTAVGQNVLFANRVGGQQFDQAMGVAVDGTGNIIATGYFAGSADFNASTSSDSIITSNGYNDVFVTKTDSAGNFMWAFNLGSTLDDFTYTNPVVDAAGNVYLCGVFSDTMDFDPAPSTAYKLISNGQWDGFVSKYDGNGTFMWVKTFGGLFNDDVYSLALSQTGDIILAGSFSITADLNPDTAAITLYNSTGGDDIYYARLSSSGNVIWLNTIGGNNFDHANAIAETIAGDIVLQGAFTTSLDADPGAATATVAGGSSAGFIAKYDAAGNYIWAKGFAALSPFGLVTDANAYVYTCGYLSGTTDMNPGAAVNILTPTGAFDAYVAKYDAMGNYLHAFKIGAAGYDYAYGLALLENNKIVVGGLFANGPDFNPATGTTNTLTSYGMADIFIATYDTALNYLNAFNAGGTQYDFCRNIVITNGNLLTAGGFTDVADFSPGAASTTLTSAGSRDGYVVKYGDVATQVAMLTGSNSSTVTIYPNPAHDVLHYQFNTPIKDLSINFYNMQGKCVLTQTVQAAMQNDAIDVAGLTGGIYAVTFVANGTQYCLRLVKSKQP